MQLRLPNELIQYIFSFNADHRINYQPTLKSLGCVVNRKRFEQATIEWLRMPFVPYRTYIRTRFADDYEIIFNHLRNCDCCLRHTVNRPTELVPWTNDMDEPDLSYPVMPSPRVFGPPCQCTCRETCRWLCHTFAS